MVMPAGRTTPLACADIYKIMSLFTGQGSLVMFSYKYIPSYNLDPCQLTLSQMVQVKIQSTTYPPVSYSVRV